MKINTCILAVLLPALVVSCKVDDPALGKDAPIDVVVGVVDTRAGYSGTAVLPDAFVMDITQNALPKYDYRNVMMVREDGTNSYAPEADIDMLWADDARNNLSVKAMTVPYGLASVDAESPMTLSVAPDQRDEDDVLASDLLVCTSSNEGDVEVSRNFINLRFRHLLTKLEISYKFGAGIDPGKVTFNSVTLSNICVSGGFAYSSMSFDNSISYGYGDVQMLNDEDESTLEAIFFPYVPSEKPKLVVDITVAGENRLLACEISPKSASGFEAGKRYTMSVTIQNNNISTSSVGISSGWNSGTVNPGTGIGSNDKTFETE